VTTRVSSYVKNVMFRKIKFVNSEIMIQRAMNSLFKFENVKEHKKLHFHRVYESVFNDALNTKRSACEQAGGKIVKATLQSMGPDCLLFTVETMQVETVNNRKGETRILLVLLYILGVCLWKESMGIGKVQ